MDSSTSPTWRPSRIRTIASAGSPRGATWPCRGARSSYCAATISASSAGRCRAGHQGGALHFGRDGKLYIAIGEQTAREPAQRLDTFQGKLLRINPDGTIPEDNPFFRKAKGKYRAIWALGLRNPFTFAVQPGTGRIFINDVGDSGWEEVNEGFAGANYGWPESEGATNDPRFRGPIHTYRVASIAGGAFCPKGAGAAFPAEYQGKYFFMDFVHGWIKVLDPDRPSTGSSLSPRG